ncbi:hypothetical protein Stsp01_25150 [Streptomyces sp. NBRC 13847]|nr:hypothetical protein Stsp01_25150 [Streptomyces sp. NBRC 13847]
MEGVGRGGRWEERAAGGTGVPEAWGAGVPKAWGAGVRSGGPGWGGDGSWKVAADSRAAPGAEEPRTDGKSRRPATGRLRR